MIEPSAQMPPVFEVVAPLSVPIKTPGFVMRVKGISKGEIVRVGNLFLVVFV
jgi:hypothetical protein